MLSNYLKLFVVKNNTRLFFYGMQSFCTSKIHKSSNSNGNKQTSDGCDGVKSGNGDKVSKDKKCEICRACPCECNPSAPTMYDCRKYGHNLPYDSALPNFEPLPGIPTGIFRCTAGEILGRGANKGSCYQNPEYFSFQHMTFYDMHLVLRNCRCPRAKTGRKN